MFGSFMKLFFTSISAIFFYILLAVHFFNGLQLFNKGSYGHIHKKFCVRS